MDTRSLAFAVLVLIFVGSARADLLTPTIVEIQAARHQKGEALVFSGTPFAANRVGLFGQRD